MNMILYTSHYNRLALEVDKYPAEVSMQLSAEIGITQEWTTIFGREYGVNKNLGKRLGHGTRFPCDTS